VIFKKTVIAGLMRNLCARTPAVACHEVLNQVQDDNVDLPVQSPTMTYFVYMLASKPQGVIYIGVTNDLIRRVYEHKSHAVKGFTQQYNVTQLVWFESSESIQSAIEREKQLKNWRRDWKIALIEENNPNWMDLYPNLLA
jgi:putative endonuclease